MKNKTKTIVLIHGLWITPRGWEQFRRYYEEKGYEVLAPAWPRPRGEVEDIRRDPSALAGLGLLEIFEHHDKFVRTLPEPHILIGHSFGGLTVQVLLDRGLGAAGTSIDGTAPKEILNQINCKKYAKSRAATAYREFPGRSHRIVAQEGWEYIIFPSGSGKGLEEDSGCHVLRCHPSRSLPKSCSNCAEPSATSGGTCSGGRGPPSVPV